MAEEQKPEEKKWVPPATIEELFGAAAGNKFAGINRPTAGPREEKPLEKGEAPFQLHSLGTPNGVKVSILLEELGIPYDAHVIKIWTGDQFTSGFVGINPNSKIPAGIDYDGPGGEPIALMESGAMLLYLCEKYPEKGFLPTDPRLRMECMQWIMWQIGGQGPMTGQYGHFMVYAPPEKCEARDYGVSRYGMETQRICDVLERHLAGYGDFKGSCELRKEGPREYLVGDRYTVADMAVLPWASMLRGKGYDRDGQPRTMDFLGFTKYEHLNKWIDRLEARIQVKKGKRVCTDGKGKPWLEEGDEMYGQ